MDIAKEHQSVVVPNSEGTPPPAAPPRRKAASREEGAGKSTRRVATSRAAVAERKFPKWLLGLLLLITLAAGIGIGALGMRQRYHSRQVLASVNETIIWYPQMHARLEQMAGTEVIRKMVEEQLQLQYAAKKKVFPNEAEVNAKLVDLQKQPFFEPSLAQRRLTVEDFKRELRLAMIKDAVLVQGIDATEAEAKDFYQKNISRTNPRALFFVPEMTQIQVIVANETRIAEAMKELKAGKDFGQVAFKYSQDNSRVRGGILNYFPKGRTKANTVPGLEEAVFGLKIGDQIGPRKFANAYWIIRCRDKTAGRVKSFDEVRSDCLLAAKLLKIDPKRRKQVEEEFDKFQRESKIRTFNPTYAALFENR